MMARTPRIAGHVLINRDLFLLDPVREKVIRS